MSAEAWPGAVSHGVNVADHQAFVQWVEENPDAAMVEFQATGVAEDVVNRTTATIGEWGMGGKEMGETREHTFTLGLPPELEEAMGFVDPGDRYEAVEVAFAGLTACINGTIAINALREGIEIDDVTTTVRAPVDVRVLLGIHDVDQADAVFGPLDIDVDVTGPNLSADDVAKVQQFHKRSPVYTLMTLAHPNEPTVTVHSS